MYNNGKNEEAFKYALEEAQKGNSTAQHSVGYLYYNGEGVTQDKNEAFKWYSKAAEQGIAASQHELGLMYFNGDGIAQDKEKGFYWFIKAAERNENIIRHLSI